MIYVIFRHQGTVEGLVGDEIVALFGVPEPGADVALRAVRAATDMVEAVGRLAARWTADGRPTFDIGIGISSGRVLAGAICSDPPPETIPVGDPFKPAPPKPPDAPLLPTPNLLCHDPLHPIDYL